MKKILFKIVKVVLISFVVLLAAALIVLFVLKGATAVKHKIRTADGVDETAYINICGQNQYVMIRGEHKSNPVIIWVHGGPASPDTMLMYYLADLLKDKYTFIAYNQRGCGRTYFANKKIDSENSTATFEQLQLDLDALVDYACERFDQKNVILMGHSFGTMVGSCYAVNHPEKLAMYIGVGQMGALGSELYAYQDALEKAAACGDDTIEFQNAIDVYKADSSVTNMLKVRAYANKYHKPKYSRNYILDALVSPICGFDDIKWFLMQMNFDKFISFNKSLFKIICEVDVYDFGTEIKVPVGFISGSEDWSTPVKYMEDYADALNAPCKRVSLIEGWGHGVLIENPEGFVSSLCSMIDELSGNSY